MDSTWLTTLDQCLEPDSQKSSITPTTNNRCIIQGLNPRIKVNSTQIHSLNLTNNQRVKIWRQTNARTVPAENTGYFGSEILSRQHAEVWEENRKVCCICSVPLFGYTLILSCAQPVFPIYFVSRFPMPFIFFAQ